MTTKNTSGLLYGAGAFVGTLIIIFFIFNQGSSSSEFEMQFHHPQKIENPDGVGYTLDTVGGPEKDLTFRCNPTTGEGYFSLKSKSLSWASSHCQDMVGGVKDVEDGKKPHATVKFTLAEKQVVYRVERNK